MPHQSFDRDEREASSRNPKRHEHYNVDLLQQEAVDSCIAMIREQLTPQQLAELVSRLSQETSDSNEPSPLVIEKVVACADTVAGCTSPRFVQIIIERISMNENNFTNASNNVVAENSQVHYTQDDASGKEASPLPRWLALVVSWIKALLKK